jgi:CBS domain-containing protein
MTVAAVLKEKGGDVVTVMPSTPLPEIAGIIASRRIGAVVVLAEAEHLAGIVSERDVVKAVASHGAAAMALTAADIMTELVTTATPRTTITEAISLMDTGYFRHLPVVDEGRMIGIISVRDVVRALIREREHEVDSLTAFVTRGAQVDGLR